MPLRCVIRPNRTRGRIFTERKLAKLLCTLTKQGMATMQSFVAAFESECPPEEQRRHRPDRSAVAEAIAVMESNVEFFAADAFAYERFLAFFGIVAVAFRYVGRYVGVPGKLVGAGVLIAEAAAKERLAAILVQKAANDGALVILRRAAANEAAFAIRAGAR